MYHQYKSGWIEVVTGCMFAGKTEELIKRVKVLDYAKKNILVFKPKIDDRYSADEIASHCGTRLKSIVVNEASEILSYITDDTEVVAVDEVQFFNKDIVEVVEALANDGVRVIVAGLDRDFRGEPFGLIPEFLTRGEFVTKLTAVCAVCGAPATRTQRIINGKPADWNDPIVLVGAASHYEPRCRHCHSINNPKIIKLKERVGSK